MADAWTVPRLWEGERCFIIAGGASARWAFHELSEKGVAHLPDRVIAIKEGFYLEINADCMFYAGRRYHHERPDLFKRWETARMKPDALTVKRTVDDGVPSYVKQVRRMGESRGIIGLSHDPAYVGGWDSGGSALNLAFHLGAKEIVLIGYDLAGVHWNPAHPYPRATPREHQRHQASIDAMAGPLANAGVKVWNTSPISTLKAFKHAEITSLV